jgi:hypothetical protein
VLFWLEVMGKSSVRGQMTGMQKVSTTLCGFRRGHLTH